MRFDRRNFLFSVWYSLAPKGRRNGAQGTTLGINGTATPSPRRGAGTEPRLPPWESTAPPWETCVGLDRRNFLFPVYSSFAPKGRRNGAQGTTLGIDGNALGIDLPFVLCIQYAAKPSRLCAAAGRYCAFVSFVTLCSRLFRCGPLPLRAARASDPNPKTKTWNPESKRSARCSWRLCVLA